MAPDSYFYKKDYARIARSLSSANSLKKERKGMGLDKTLTPKEFSNNILFLSCFSSPYPPEQGDGNFSSRCSKRSREKLYHVSVGCISTKRSC